MFCLIKLFILCDWKIELTLQSSVKNWCPLNLFSKFQCSRIHTDRQTAGCLGLKRHKLLGADSQSRLKLKMTLKHMDHRSNGLAVE